MTMWWVICKFKNDITFGNHNVTRDNLVDLIVDYSYFWFVNRNKKFNVLWVDWLKNSIMAMGGFY